LSKQERESLQALIRRGTAAQRDVERARLALMVHEGHTTSAIASSLGLSRPTVTLWRYRLACFGVEGLQEAPRPGRPRRLADAPAG
jgi:transposase